jgi:hypothetical protein
MSTQFIVLDVSADVHDGNTIYSHSLQKETIGLKEEKAKKTKDDKEVRTDRDIILAYYSHISKLINTCLALTISVTIGWLAFLYICLQNIALKSSVLGFIIGFTLNILFAFAFLAVCSYDFILYLMELDLGIRNYVNNLTFPTWMGSFGQRRKKLLYLNISELVALSILIGFYLISSLYVFGLWLFISLLILFTVIIVGSITNLKKAIKEKPKVFSKFKK